MDTQPAILQQILGVSSRHPRSRTEAEQRWKQVRHQGFHRHGVTLLVANHQVAELVFALVGLHSIARAGLQAVIGPGTACDITD
jgi:hypothetical protein